MPDAPFSLLDQTQWFLPLFAAMWFGIGGLLAHLGGWARLATCFRAVAPASGERFRFVSGSMGLRFIPVSYGSCLFVSVNESGLHLSLFPLFRFQSPPLFIPWSRVQSVEEKTFLFTPYVVVRVRDHWPTIAVWGNAGRCIAKAFKNASSSTAL